MKIRTAKAALRRAAAASTIAGATGLLMLGLAGTASAHVSANVYGDQPEKGGYGAIVLRVPNEDPDAGTVKLEVSIPTEYAITSARTTPVPGWNAEVTTTTLDTPVTNGAGAEVSDVVTSITWTAEQSTMIGPGTHEYQEFAVSLGRLPSDLDTLVLPTAQTYSDGKVVNWDAAPTPGGEHPEHPAPTVALADPSGHGHGAENSAAGSSGSGNSTGMSGMTGMSQMGGTADSTARWLGGAGLVVGALGLGVGAAATIRANKAAKVAGAPRDES